MNDEGGERIARQVCLKFGRLDKGRMQEQVARARESGDARCIKLTLEPRSSPRGSAQTLKRELLSSQGGGKQIRSWTAACFMARAKESAGYKHCL